MSDQTPMLDYETASPAPKRDSDWWGVAVGCVIGVFCGALLGVAAIIANDAFNPPPEWDPHGSDTTPGMVIFIAVVAILGLIGGARIGPAVQERIRAKIARELSSGDRPPSDGI